MRCARHHIRTIPQDIPNVTHHTAQLIHNNIHTPAYTNTIHPTGNINIPLPELQQRRTIILISNF